MRVMHRSAWLTVLALGVGLGVVLEGCRDLPRDPEHTLERVEHGTMRVGVAHAPPWTIVGPAGDADVSGTEVDLARALAHELDATIVWSTAGEQELLDRLEHHELDVVLGGIDDDDPRRDRVAVTAPWSEERACRHGSCRHEVKHVLALPPGENRWVMRVERFLAKRREGTDPS
jgi:polar amino acid transport system substrate-binding protein